ncbi:MAG: RNA methyltransferase [Chloroflexi bacterium]|nr:RNA methyltransferase [Chloroflexota bacterium]
MPIERYEIRKCRSCGLRYPLAARHPHGARCPACLGETRLLLSRSLNPEPHTVPAAGTHPRASRARFPQKRPSRRRAVLLDNIRSAWNVGSIVRTADGFGFEHVFLCGISPTPENEAVTKTSLGAEGSVPWSHHRDAVTLARGLKKAGWQLYALEDDDRAVPLPKGKGLKGDTVLIVGNEVTGVDPALLDLCDGIFHIPMYGQKTSFNAAIAFGIAAYALTEVNRPQKRLTVAAD